MPCSILCHLPERGIGEFYPYIMSSVLLVVPIDFGEDGPILHFDTPARPCCEFAVRHLHRWICPCGIVAVLPPAFSPDIGLPNIYPLDDMEYTASASDDDANEMKWGTQQ